MSENSVSLYILKALKQEGIDHIFLVPGYNVDSFVENYAKADIQAVVAAHEGGAAYMADGYARARQSFGVCMGLGGPGVTNMVTAIAAAYADRSPVLVVTAALPPEWDGDGPFQDSNPTGVDDCEIMRPITVWAQRIRAVYKKKENSENKNAPVFQLHPAFDKVGDFLQKAIRAMRGVENRPAFLSLPLEMMEETYDHHSYQPLCIREPARAIDTYAVKKVPEVLASAARITILAGNGCVWSQASKEIQEFAEEFSIPVVTTLRAKGLISEAHPLSFGFFGVSGTLQANKVVMGNAVNPEIPGAEVLLVLGATLNENNTYAWWDQDKVKFSPSKVLVRVDINPNNVTGKNYKETFVAGDVRTFLNWLHDHKAQFEAALHASQPERRAWLESIRQTDYHDDKEKRESDQVPFHPARVVVELRKIAPSNTVLVVDSGAHSYHVPHHWKSYAPNEFLILTNTGPMGYGVAVAIGAKMARPDRPCVAVVGDGSLLMHGMEIHTAVRYRVPLIVLVINNEALGNVYLRSIYDQHPWPDEARELAEIAPRLNCVDFACSLGADGILVEHPDELAGAFEQAFRFTESRKLPFVVDVWCCRDCKVPNSPYDYEKPTTTERASDLSMRSHLFRYR